MENEEENQRGDKAAAIGFLLLYVGGVAGFGIAVVVAFKIFTANLHWRNPHFSKEVKVYVGFK